MVPITDELIDEMVRAIVDEVDPEQVILFGSRARGEAGERSDIDLIVLEAEPFGPERSRHQELVRLYRAIAGFPVAADVLVYSREDVDYWRDSLNHVLARALREGKVLYGRRHGAILKPRRLHTLCGRVPLCRRRAGHRTDRSHRRA